MRTLNDVGRVGLRFPPDLVSMYQICNGVYQREAYLWLVWPLNEVVDQNERLRRCEVPAFASIAGVHARGHRGASTALGQDGRQCQSRRCPVGAGVLAAGLAQGRDASTPGFARATQSGNATQLPPLGQDTHGGMSRRPGVASWLGPKPLRPGEGGHPESPGDHTTCVDGMRRRGT